MKQIAQVNPRHSKDGRGISPEVIGRRLGKAFPELVKWFDWLDEGYSVGAAWQGLLVAHIARIGQLRTRALLCEAGDVQLMGIRDARNLEVLVCDVLGLSRDFVEAEAETVGRAMTMLEHELLTLSL
jgi:hypothetical protein